MHKAPHQEPPPTPPPPTKQRPEPRQRHSIGGQELQGSTGTAHVPCVRRTPLLQQVHPEYPDFGPLPKWLLRRANPLAFPQTFHSQERNAITSLYRLYHGCLILTWL